MIRESVGSHTAQTRYRTHSGQRGTLIERLVGLRGYKSFEEICQLGGGLLAIQLDARSGSEERFDLDDIRTNFGLFFRRASIGIIGARGDAPEKHVEGNGEQDNVVETVVEGSLVLKRTGRALS